MKRRTFRQWMGGLGLVAALLLVLVPGVGRMATAHAHHGHAVAQVAAGNAGHAQGMHRATPAAKGGATGATGTRAAIGDPDCDYCPLLASMTTVAGVAFVLAHVPAADRPAARTVPVRLRWWHPSGLGSRGPP